MSGAARVIRGLILPSDSTLAYGICQNLSIEISYKDLPRRDSIVAVADAARVTEAAEGVFSSCWGVLTGAGCAATGLLRASQSESKAPALCMVSNRRSCLSQSTMGSVKWRLLFERVCALEQSAMEVSDGWRHPLSLA